MGLLPGQVSGLQCPLSHLSPVPAIRRQNWLCEAKARELTAALVAALGLPVGAVVGLTVPPVASFFAGAAVVAASGLSIGAVVLYALVLITLVSGIYQRSAVNTSKSKVETHCNSRRRTSASHPGTYLSYKTHTSTSRPRGNISSRISSHESRA